MQERLCMLPARPTSRQAGSGRRPATTQAIGAAFAVAADAGEHGPTIIDAAKHAFVDGWINSMWLGVGMAAVGLAYLVLRGPKRALASTAPTTSAPVEVPVS